MGSLVYISVFGEINCFIIASPVSAGVKVDESFLVDFAAAYGDFP